MRMNWVQSGPCLGVDRLHPDPKNGPLDGVSPYTKRTLVRLRVISPLGKSARRYSCALTVDMSISGFAAIMPSAVSSG